jgi:Predicted membrane protein (DUF2238)
MPLSWNEIRSRAHEFSKRWEGESSERAEAQSFWNEFFSVFGIERKRVAIFEKQVSIARAGHKLKQGRIDAFWKGVLLIEHKSMRQDLSRAFAQAADYFEGLAARDLPRYILVSDFAHFRLTSRKMAAFLSISVAVAISAWYELIEWWSALALALGQGADEFLGTQGDPWDTQSDMFLAFIGATAAMILLSRWHDSQMYRMKPGVSV